MTSHKTISGARVLRAAAFAFLCAAATIACAADLDLSTISAAQLPSDISIQGSFKAGVRWYDASGENLAVFSKSTSKGSEGRNADLHAVGFRIVDGKAVQTWKVHDWISDCPVDLPVFFEPASIEVTDLDGNGLAEVSFVYRIACLGGVDEIEEKLFLIENGKKYPIRGATQWMRHDDDTDKDVYDGTMKIDVAFDAAPKVFKQFAVKKWRKFKAPNWKEGER